MCLSILCRTHLHANHRLRLCGSAIRGVQRDPSPLGGPRRNRLGHEREGASGVRRRPVRRRWRPLAAARAGCAGAR